MPNTTLPVTVGDSGIIDIQATGGVRAVGTAAACNVRLTVDGQLHLCLGQEHRVPLGALMRAGADDASLMAHIDAGMARKPERHEFHTAAERVVRFMSQTGG